MLDFTINPRLNQTIMGLKWIFWVCGGHFSPRLNQTIMGLKYFLTPHTSNCTWIKSDHNGIEITTGEYTELGEPLIKSDHNGIEIILHHLEKHNNPGLNQTIMGLKFIIISF